MQKWTMAALLVAVAAVLGATVFREQVAEAAATLNVIVKNDSSNPVPVAGNVGINGTP
jgi:biopolymer transport protein ExbB/TolQ